MRKLMNKIDRFCYTHPRFGIPNLMLIIVIGNAAVWLLAQMDTTGQIVSLLSGSAQGILHGQVWRLVTWVIAPPSSFDIFTIIMLLFYFNLGTSLERTWGTWQYNVYIFTGIFLTVIGSFLCMGLYYLILGDAITPQNASLIFAMGAGQFSTYYINMSIFLAFAATFPDVQVLLMFVIPVKVKWLGVVYAVFLLVELIQYYSLGMYYWFAVAAIGASLLNFVVFYLRSRHSYMHLNPKQMKRKMEFRQDVKRNSRITKHKCAICGRTEEDDPTLEFRFCSKCNGNYEYCQYHLFTHEHRK